MDWLALFQRENVRFVILGRRTDGSLIRLLRRQCGWLVDFEDGESVIFARRST